MQRMSANAWERLSVCAPASHLAYSGPSFSCDNNNGVVRGRPTSRTRTSPSRASNRRAARGQRRGRAPERRHGGGERGHREARRSPTQLKPAAASREGRYASPPGRCADRSNPHNGACRAADCADGRCSACGIRCPTAVSASARRAMAAMPGATPRMPPPGGARRGRRTGVRRVARRSGGRSRSWSTGR